MNASDRAVEQLFNSLSHAVEGAPLIALGASFVWGILSIILSPCHLASIPLIVGFISGQGQVTTRRAFWTLGVATVNSPAYWLKEASAELTLAWIVVQNFCKSLCLPPRLKISRSSSTRLIYRHPGGNLPSPDKPLM